MKDLEQKDNRKRYMIPDDIMLDNGDGTSDNWHITQMNSNGTMDEVILGKEALKKLYLSIGEILIK